MAHFKYSRFTVWWLDTFLLIENKHFDRPTPFLSPQYSFFVRSSLGRTICECIMLFKEYYWYLQCFPSLIGKKKNILWNRVTFKRNAVLFVHLSFSYLDWNWLKQIDWSFYLCIVLFLIFHPIILALLFISRSLAGFRERKRTAIACFLLSFSVIIIIIIICNFVESGMVFS